MGNLMNYQTLFSGTIAGIFMAGTALAADVEEAFPKSEKIKEERSFYLGISAGPEALVVSLDDGDVDDLIANSFVGVGGTVQVCRRGVGSARFIDLCLGGHVFRSLTGGASESTQLDPVTGAGLDINSDADVTSFAGFVQAKVHGGPVFFSPFAGVRRFNTDVEFDDGALLVAEELSDTALFGGAELGFNAFNKRIEIGLVGEGGSSVSDTDFTYGRFGGFIRAKF